MLSSSSSSSSLLRFVSVAASLVGLTRAVDPTVALNYSTYVGTAQTGGTGVTEWLGIRYAAPPLGDLRFQRPQDPVVNTTVQIADQVGFFFFLFFCGRFFFFRLLFLPPSPFPIHISCLISLWRSVGIGVTKARPAHEKSWFPWGICVNSKT